MPATLPAPASAPTRDEQVEAIVAQRRPRIEEAVRAMVERAADVPEAEEFGATDTAFRDAGQGLATQIRQAGLTSRGKRGASGAA